MEPLPERNLRFLSGFALKWIAIASMILDHFGSILMTALIEPYRTDGIFVVSPELPFLVRNAFLIKGVCEILGSIGFPLFCFLIAEGFLHTRSRLRYAITLGVFALISEIPFDLAHFQSLSNFKLQNVLFTLSVSAFTLLAIAHVERRWAERPLPRWGLTACCTGLGMVLALLLRGEYVFLGVLTIALLYLLRNLPLLRPLGIAPLLIVSPWVLVALVPLYLYDGRRGRGSKWFFYLFYPGHFLLFALAAYRLANPG